MMKLTIYKIILLIVPFLFFSCGDDFEKTPLDKLIKELDKAETYSVILQDMDTEGFFFTTFKHKYKVIKEKSGKLSEYLTNWEEVKEEFFTKHLNNMGMELLNKNKEGKIEKKVTPPGFGNYVGNKQYGTWKENNGTSFWEFYGKYAMLQNVFGLFSSPVRYNDWGDYRRNYYNKGKTYYGKHSIGSKSKSYYGTNSAYTQKNNKTSAWKTRASNSSFKDKVNSKVSRSSSRYSGGSSSRSRGGGSGK